MSYLTAAQIARIKARITVKEAALAGLDAAYTDAQTKIKEYRFDSGEGSQRVMHRDLAEFSRQIAVLESEIDALYRRLDGTGVVNMGLRRHG